MADRVAPDGGVNGGRWLLVVLFLAPIIAVTAAVVELLLGGSSATLGEWGYVVDTNPAAFLPTIAFATLVPLLEELGWRGYALDRLQLEYSALVSSTVLGIVRPVWPLPLFFIEVSYQHDMTGFGPLEFWMFMIGIVLVSVAITWVYNNTARSVLIATVMHGWANVTLQSIELTGRSEVSHIALWFVAAAFITAFWERKLCGRTTNYHTRLEPGAEWLPSPRGMLRSGSQVLLDRCERTDNEPRVMSPGRGVEERGEYGGKRVAVAGRRATRLPFCSPGQR